MTSRKSGRINAIKLKQIASVQKKCLFCTSDDTSEISKISFPPLDNNEVEDGESIRVLVKQEIFSDHEDEPELHRQQRSSTRFKSQEETANYYPASNLSHSCATLEDQLKSIFILQKLLEISGEKLQHYLETYGDNPDTWFNVCARCREIVGECIFLHRKITRLARTFNRKKYSLQKLICQSREDLESNRDWKKTKLTYDENEELGVFFDVRKNFEMSDTYTTKTNPPMPEPAPLPTVPTDEPMYKVEESHMEDDHWDMAEPDFEPPPSPMLEQNPSTPTLEDSSLAIEETDREHETDTTQSQDLQQPEPTLNSGPLGEISLPEPEPAVVPKNRRNKKKKGKKILRCKFPWCDFTTYNFFESNNHARMHKRLRHQKNKPPKPEPEIEVIAVKKIVIRPPSPPSPSPPPSDSEFEDNSSDEDWAPTNDDVLKSSEVEIVEKKIDAPKPKPKPIKRRKTKTPTDTPLITMEGESDMLMPTSSNNNAEETSCSNDAGETTSGVSMEKETANVESNDKKPFLCGECPARFAKPHTRLRHFNQLHKKGLGEKCPECGVFVHHENLYYHRVKEHKVIIKNVQVLKVLTPEAEETLKLRHNDIRTNFRRIPYYCEAPHCPMIFVSPFHIVPHVKLYHKDEPLVPCEYCERQFETKQLLKLHCVINHKDQTGSETRASLEGEFPKPEQCKFCEEWFTSKWKMDYHVAKAHKDVLLKCPEEGCEYIARHYLRYRQHIDLKHRNVQKRRYVCDICSKLLATQYTLESHQRAEHFLELGLEPIICETCGVPFGSQGALESHINTVHLKQKQIGDYICHECGRDFASKTGLDRHYQIQHGDSEPPKKSAKKKRQQGPFSCKFCDLTLGSHGGFFKHTRKFHSDKLRHKCSKCGIGFAFIKGLFRHQNECTGSAPKRRKTSKKPTPSTSTSNDGTPTVHESNWVNNTGMETEGEVRVGVPENEKVDLFQQFQSYQFSQNMTMYQ